MLTYHNDNRLKFDYNPKLYSIIEYNNIVGPTDSLTKRTLDFTPSNSNSIFVSKSGNDTNDGTMENPVLTITKALTLCNNQYIVILDSGTYKEQAFDITSTCLGIISALGHTPKIIPTFNANHYQHGKYVLKHSYLGIINDVVGVWNTGILSNGNIVVAYVDNNKIYFRIVTSKGEEVIGKTLVNDNCNAVSIAIAVFPNDDFVIFYTNYVNANSYYNVFNSSGVEITTKKTLTSPNAYLYPIEVDCCVYNDTNIAFITRTVGRSSYPSPTWDLVYFYLSQKDGTVIANGAQPYFNGTNANGGTSHGVSIIGTKDKGFLMCYSMHDRTDGTPVNHHVIRLTKHNSAGARIYSTAVYDLGSAGWNTNAQLIRLGEEQATNNYIIIYTRSTGITEYIVTAADTSVIKAHTQMIGAASTATAACGGVGGYFDIFYVSNEKLYHRRYDANGNVYQIEKVLYNADIKNIKSYMIAKDDLFYIVQKKDNIIDAHQAMRSTWYGISISTGLYFNGITIDGDNSINLSYLIISTGALTFKWCKICNTSLLDFTSYETKAIISSGIINMLNCIIFGNGGGIEVTSNNVDIKYTQFYRNYTGYALIIDGTGANISNCDFYRNYGGILLKNNNGNEIIKNNIFFNISLFAIKADTPITYSYSINTAIVINTIAGLSIINANPHYINDGSLNPDDINLNLKRKELGYRYNSPAIMLGDDGKNAGALDVTLSDIYESWTPIEVDKGQFKVTIEPVGDVKVDYKDGSTATYRDSYKEVLEIKWTALSNADLEKLKGLYYCNNPTVRIYPDPITYPNAFNTYTLIYDKVNASTKHNKLSRTGISDFSLTFERAYNEGA